eukprot:jgi/Ulvmu1/2328/UM013_0176.1
MDWSENVPILPTSLNQLHDSIDLSGVFGDPLEGLFDDFCLDDSVADGLTKCASAAAGTVPTQQDSAHTDGRRSKVSAEQRLEKTRARNRAAQARFRQKQKEEMLVLQQSIADKQQLLSASKARLAASQAENSQILQSFGHRYIHERTPPNTSATETTVGRLVVNSAQPFTSAGGHRGPAQLSAASATALAPSLIGAQLGNPTHNMTSNPMHADAPRSLIPRHTTATLYQAQSPLPPTISSFRATAGIGHVDLLEASGSTSGTLDFSVVSMPELVRRVRVSKAARLGCAPEEVCYFVQLHWDAATELPMGTAAQAAVAEAAQPLSLSSTLSTPECVASFAIMVLLADLEGLLRSSRIGTVEPSASESDESTSQHTSKRACSRSNRPATAVLDNTHPDTAPPCCGSAAPPAYSTACCQSCRSRVGRTLRTLRGSTWSGLVTCGVHETCCARCAVRNVVRQVVCRAYGSDRGERLWAMCRKVQREVVTMAGDVQNGVGGDGGDGGDGTTAARLDERALAVAKLNDAAAGALLVVWDVLDELLAGELNLDADPGIGSSGVPFREYTFKACIAQGLGITQVYRDAPRTIRTMALNSSYTLLKYFEVENMHVQLYRQLGLSAADKERMADVWQAWERRRRSLNKPYHAALAALRNVPGPAAVPGEIVRCVIACSADLATTAEQAQHAQVSASDDGMGDVGMGGGHGESVHEGHAYGSVIAAGWYDRSPSMAANGNTQRLHCAGLLGECPVATGAAMHALQGLEAVHRADSDLYLEIVELQCQPEALLSLEQAVTVYCAHLMHEVAQADFIALCQLAASQRSRTRMHAFKMPSVRLESPCCVQHGSERVQQLPAVAHAVARFIST